jgi:hypothetical protein
LGTCSSAAKDAAQQLSAAVEQAQQCSVEHAAAVLTASTSRERLEGSHSDLQACQLQLDRAAELSAAARAVPSCSERCGMDSSAAAAGLSLPAEAFRRLFAVSVVLTLEALCFSKLSPYASMHAASIPATCAAIQSSVVSTGRVAAGLPLISSTICLVSLPPAALTRPGLVRCHCPHPCLPCQLAGRECTAQAGSGAAGAACCAGGGREAGARREAAASGDGVGPGRG